MEKMLDKKVETIIHADYKKENQKMVTKGAVISFLLIVLVSSLVGFIAIKNSPSAQCEKYARMMYIKDHKEEPEFDYLLIEYTNTLKDFKEKTSVSYQGLYNITSRFYDIIQAQFEMGKMPEIGMLRLMELAGQFLPNEYNHPELIPVSEEDVTAFFKSVTVTAWYASGNKIED